MSGGAISRYDQDRMLDWLVEAAARGAMCPTNDQIAGRFGYASTASSSRLIQQLEDRGKIRVERFHRHRVVTVIATGVATRRPDRAAPRTQGGGQAPKVAQPVTVPAKPRVSAAVLRAVRVDGRDLWSFISVLIDMGLECWRDDRVAHGEPLA